MFYLLFWGDMPVLCSITMVKCEASALNLQYKLSYKLRFWNKSLYTAKTHDYCITNGEVCWNTMGRYLHPSPPFFFLFTIILFLYLWVILWHFQCLDYIALDNRMICERLKRIWNWSWPNWGTVWAFAWRNWEKLQKAYQDSWYSSQELPKYCVHHCSSNCTALNIQLSLM